MVGSTPSKDGTTATQGDVACSGVDCQWQTSRTGSGQDSTIPGANGERGQWNIGDVVVSMSRFDGPEHQQASIRDRLYGYRCQKSGRSAS